MAYMYGGTILRVDLSKGKVSKEPTSSYSGDFLGGRGINIKLLYDELPAGVDPFDPASPLIFGVGPLCGTPVPSSRIEVTAKSPETGFLGASNFGGAFCPELKFAGYDNIVFTGKADKPVYLWINNEQVEIRDASHLWGKDTYQTQEIIRSEVDHDVKIACIGSAGESLIRFATIQSELGHGAGRTGMGAVMGSKNLKAIVVRGTKGITIANPEQYLSIASELEQTLRNHPGVQERQTQGMSFKIDRPQRRKGSRKVYSSDLFLKYKPKIQRTGCLGCPTQCMDLYPVEAKGGGVLRCGFYGQPFYSVRNSDVEVMLECGLLAQRHGIDIVSSMVMIAWLMELYEKGVITAKDTDGIPMEWGSPQAILSMFKKIIHREGFGNVLADGILPAADRIGRKARNYAPHMKGLPLYDGFEEDDIIPNKGRALCFAISSRGDTMKVNTNSVEEMAVNELSLLYDGRKVEEEAGKELPKLDDKRRGAEVVQAGLQRIKNVTGTEKAFRRDEYEGKPELAAYMEDTVTINDCLSACKLLSEFLDYPFHQKYEAALFSAGTGVETSEDKLFQFARRVKNLERAYCVREGMTRDMDSLPKRFMDYPIVHTDLDYRDINNIHTVQWKTVLESSKFEKMKDRYYTLRGWDIATGIPTQKTLEEFGLAYVVQDLKREGKLPKISSEG